MTRAPANLLAVRTLLLTHLDNAPGPDDLQPAEAGIVGDPAHRGGYHCGSDRTVTNDYSVFESPRDRAGLTLDAAALDVGEFEVTVGGRTYNLPHFSAWVVAQCKANAADTRDIREVIYSLDGRTVKRWDRLGKRTTGDSSHRWHTHFSFFRDAIKAGRDQRPLFLRYLTTIGLIKAPTVKDPDMAFFDEKQIDGRSGAQLVKDIWWLLVKGNPDTALYRGLTQLGVNLDAVDLDEATIVQGVLAGLTPEKIAAAIPPAQTKAVADELARRLVAGEPTTPQS